ncbi:hypothetical protein LDG_6204 [Legionella drancourtii LLAP12]|uniref:Uncharacterized protein n=1 Tax=Legionella drancourtii LLAP12 TaxID=658187 RepID=G9ELU4_9GAMM|nr:hypothetical protein LDG_6204 [Legionella drancourtii LLAP12]
MLSSYFTSYAQSYPQILWITCFVFFIYKIGAKAYKTTIL